jgi:ribonuclease P protein component
VIWRIRERRAFDRLGREGRRTRAGALWCTSLTDPTVTPPQVAYALGRAVGPAVVRNRIRRQLRAALRDRELPPGWYLIGARPTVASQSRAALMFDLERLLRSLGAPTPTTATATQITAASSRGPGC